MKKVISLTEKLDFAAKPVIVIKDEKIEVNNDAMTALKIIGMASTAEERPEIFGDMAELLFGKQGKKSIEKLGLTFGDFQTVVETAMDLIMGEEDDEAPEKASTI